MFDTNYKISKSLQIPFVTNCLIIYLHVIIFLVKIQVYRNEIIEGEYN